MSNILSLEQRIINYMSEIRRRNPEVWIHKGDLEDVVKGAGYLGDTGARRIRELCADGILEARSKGKSTEYRSIF